MQGFSALRMPTAALVQRKEGKIIASSAATGEKWDARYKN
jgi:hypothetical protein